MKITPSTTCSRCGSANDLSMRYVACGAVGYCKDQGAAFGRYYKDELAVWQVYLCKNCFKGASSDKLRSDQSKALRQSVMSSFVVMLFGSYVLLVDGRIDNLIDFLMSIGLLGGALFCIGGIGDYTKAKFKLWRLTSGVNTGMAFEGQAQRILSGKPDPRFPKPRWRQRTCIFDPMDLGKSELSVIAIENDMDKLMKSLGNDWRNVFAKQTTERSTETLNSALRRVDVASVRNQLAAGADAKAHAEDGTSPISALFLGADEWDGVADIDVCAIIRVLIAHGADVNSKPPSGWTPLHSAAYIGLNETAKALLSAGVNVDAPADGNVTPLLVAVRQFKPDLVRLLVSHGANPDAMTTNGKSPRSIASESIHNTKILDLLSEVQLGTVKR